MKNSNKFRVVCFINQFFGAVGGEEKADIGFSVSEKPIGPTVLIDNLLKGEGEVVATIICGDNYFADNIEEALSEGLKLVKKYKPDIFFSGPSFNAGRYGISSGNMASYVAKELNIPTVTAMYEENPAVELFRKDTYIIKTGIYSSSMKLAVEKMINLGFRLLKGEKIFGAEAEGYIKRDLILNERCEKNSAQRAIDMLLKKVKGESFISEILPPIFDKVEAAPPIKDIKKAKIAIVTDGGLIPESNPDKLKPNGSTNWGYYDFNELISNKHYVIHSGYDGTSVLDNPYRLLPYDALLECVSENKIGSLDEKVYIACGNCASISASKDIGIEMAQKLIERDVQGVILTST